MIASITLEIVNTFLHILIDGFSKVYTKMTSMKSILDFPINARGGVATIAALCSPLVIVAALASLDITAISAEHMRLQEATDAGALAGAGRLSIASNIASGPTQTAIAVTKQTALQAKISDTVNASATTSPDGSSLTVDATVQHTPLVSLFGVRTISATSTAETMGHIPLCILQTGSTNLTLENAARIRATGCAVHSNQDISVSPSGIVQANLVQAVGTISGPVSPTGHSGALRIEDPFSGMNLAAPTPCQGTLPALKAVSGTTLLPAGAHCQNIIMAGMATLQLAPGVHYFQGNLTMSQNTLLSGDDVTLIFSGAAAACPTIYQNNSENQQGNNQNQQGNNQNQQGNNQQGNQDDQDYLGENPSCGKTFSFTDSGSVRLTASKSGPFAGFLIVTDRTNKNTFTIASGNVSQLLGTIYIPETTLLVTTAGNVAANSAWSVIVAKKLILRQNPVLVINTGYIGSGVPVPSGVGPNRGTVALAR